MLYGVRASQVFDEEGQTRIAWRTCDGQYSVVTLVHWSRVGVVEEDGGSVSVRDER